MQDNINVRMPKADVSLQVWNGVQLDFLVPMSFVNFNKREIEFTVTLESSFEVILITLGRDFKNDIMYKD